MASITGLSDSLISELGQVRKAFPVIQYQGVDVSSTFVPSLKDFVFKEGFGDHQMADTLEITLADPEGLFRRSWSLETGQTVSASIVVQNWNGPGTGTLTKPLGIMYIKGVRIEQTKGAGTTVRISCTSIDPATSFRLEKKTRAWTQTTVRDVSRQIATDNNLKLDYPTSLGNPAMQRVDQHDHSDAYMMKKITSDNDFTFRITNNTLWVRDRHAVETGPTVGTIVCPSTGNIGGINGSGVIRWEFLETTEDANYSEADLKYKDPTTGNTVSETAVDPNHKDGPHLNYHKDPRTGEPNGIITLQ